MTNPGSQLNSGGKRRKLSGVGTGTGLKIPSTGFARR